MNAAIEGSSRSALILREPRVASGPVTTGGWFLHWLLCFYLSVLAGQSTQAGIMREDVPEQEYLDFAADPLFDPVGVVWVSPNSFDEGTGLSCTATLIAPQWVMTCGHCGLEYPSGVREIGFWLGDDLDQEVTHYQVPDAWYVHPDYWYQQEVGIGADLALIHLPEPITDVTPAVRFRGEDTLDIVAQMAGFGRHGIINEADTDKDWKKRAGTKVVYGFGGEYQNYLISTEPQYMHIEFDELDSPDLQPLEWGGAPGDSGSPWFNESGEIIGVTRGVLWYYVYPYPHHYGYNTIALRTSLYNDWIDSYVIPEPNAAFLAILGASWGVLARRRF